MRLRKFVLDNKCIINITYEGGIIQVKSDKIHLPTYLSKKLFDKEILWERNTNWKSTTYEIDLHFAFGNCYFLDKFYIWFYLIGTVLHIFRSLLIYLNSMLSSLNF